MGPKLMNCCRPEQVGTTDHGEMFNNNSGSRRWHSFCKGGKKHGKLKDKKNTRKEYQRLVNKFEMEGFMAQRGLWNLARNKTLQDRGALPTEEGDAIREF